MPHLVVVKFNSKCQRVRFDITVIVFEKIESVTMSSRQSIENTRKMPGVKIHYYMQQEDYDPDFVTNYLVYNTNIYRLSL